jgi:TM2 domain-containing membrane protein YozV
MKSKPLAYLLWFFFGVFGIHKFYLNKPLVGILYIFTLGIFFIGWFIDAFTLGTQVDAYNALNQKATANNVVINHYHSH